MVYNIFSPIPNGILSVGQLTSDPQARDLKGNFTAVSCKDKFKKMSYLQIFQKLNMLDEPFTPPRQCYIFRQKGNLSRGLILTCGNHGQFNP